MVRIALIGCGRISTVHAAAIAAHPRAELASVRSRTAGPATKLAKRYDVPAFTDPAVVLADEFETRAPRGPRGHGSVYDRRVRDSMVARRRLGHEL
jgi:Oxidoreductase family, NAD-binding Rossmann fold